MSAALEYRITAGYVLALVPAIMLYFRRTIPPLGKDASRLRSKARGRILGVWSVLIGVFVLAPDQIMRLHFDTFLVVRWLTLIPMLAALLLLVYTARSRMGLDNAGLFAAEGPYSWSRYPLDLALVVLTLAVGVFVSNYLLLTASIVAAVILCFAVPREQERVRESLLGSSYLAYAADVGRFLPTLSNDSHPLHYSVPKRFGLTAVLALLTTLALVFGALRYANASPVVYLFLGSEILAICLVQIFFNAVPRGASALTGAVLLPLWSWFLMPAMPLPTSLELTLMVLLGVGGALFGYAVGVLAAGFFLITDLVEMQLARKLRDVHLSDAEGYHSGS